LLHGRAGPRRLLRGAFTFFTLFTLLAALYRLQETQPNTVARWRGAASSRPVPCTSDPIYTLAWPSARSSLGPSPSPVVRFRYFSVHGLRTCPETFRTGLHFFHFLHSGLGAGCGRRLSRADFTFFTFFTRNAWVKKVNKMNGSPQSPRPHLAPGPE
jgi:hypothetical protein